MIPKVKEVGVFRAVLWWILAVGGVALLMATPKIVFDYSLKWLVLLVPLILAWFLWLTYEYMRWGWGRRRW